MKQIHFNLILALTLAGVSLQAQCPLTAANLSFNPNKAKYCRNENITVTLNTTNTIFSLNWSFTGGATSTNTSAINIFNINQFQNAGNVNVTGSTKTQGGQNCPVNITVTLLLDPPMTVNAGLDVTLGGMQNQATLGGAPTLVSGGTSPFSYGWLPVTNLSSPSVANPVVTTPAANTNYVVTVTDQYNCTAQDNVNAFVITTNKHYAILKKKLDAGYYNSVTTSGTKYFYFKFDEEYYVPANTNLTYRIYDDAGTLINSTPPMLETIGDNRFALNVNSLTANAYYKIYVYNQKNEVWEGRLKVN